MIRFNRESIPKAERRIYVRHKAGIGGHTNTPQVDAHDQLENILGILAGKHPGDRSEQRQNRSQATIGE